METGDQFMCYAFQNTEVNLIIYSYMFIINIDKWSYVLFRNINAENIVYVLNMY